MMAGLELFSKGKKLQNNETRIHSLHRENDDFIVKEKSDEGR